MAGPPRERGSRASRKGRPVRAGPAAAASSDPDSASGGDSAPRDRNKADELELEDRLLKRLEETYTAALARLADLGHDQDAALEAVLHTGHCSGKLEDPVAEIVDSACTYLSSPDHAGRTGGFANLRRLLEYSLAGLVCLLQRSRPTLTRDEAMWCLLSSDLRLKEAIARGACLDCGKTPPPVVAPAQRGCRSSGHPFAKKLSTEELMLIDSVVSELEALDIDNKNPLDVNPDPKDQMVRELIKQTREMEVQLKERKEWARGKAIQAARKLGTDLTELRVLRMERDQNERNKKEKMIMDDDTMKRLFQLETELKTESGQLGPANGLRVLQIMEGDQNQHNKKEKMVMDDDTLKRLSQLETELKTKSGQLDRSNAAVQRLELENAEIRAEMEATKLSASETEKQCQSLVWKQRKANKKLEAWERQKAKLTEEIADCKTNITQAERELSELNMATKNMEIQIREDTKTKQDNIELLEEEHMKRKTTKVNADRRLAELRWKKQIESQCYKDDLHRLEGELNHLQKSTGRNQQAFWSTHYPDTANQSPTRAPKQPIQRPTPASYWPPQPIKKPSHRRECVVCKEEEACVILLQCTHQVLCVGCNKLHQDKGVTQCPCCCAKVDERIRVFAASSN